MLYQKVLKPIFFKFDAEFVHTAIVRLGELLDLNKVTRSATKALLAYQNPRLSKTVAGITFANPVGLAAGFDYDGRIAGTLKYVGFGFNTVGTVTAKPYEGNSKPRLARLPKSSALLVNKGFKSEGADQIAKRLDSKKLDGVVGISVGSSNLPEIDNIKEAVEDYVYTFNVFKDKPYVKYFELNISCPNTSVTETFIDRTNFEALVVAVKDMNTKQPIFVKMPNEISLEESDILVETAMKHGINGFIFSNLIKDRSNKGLVKEEVEKMASLKGNFSGKPCVENSNRLIKHTKERFGNSVVIIGCGGIFSAQDAKQKLEAGADLVQLITGMIYEGPQLIGNINRGLASN